MVHFEQWEGFEGPHLARRGQRSRLYSEELQALTRGTSVSLAGPTEATDKLWGILQKLQKGGAREGGGVLDMETHVVPGLTGLRGGLHQREADKALEQIVGLQTISRSSARSCRSAASRWRRKPAATTAMSRPRGCKGSSPVRADPQRRRVHGLHPGDEEGAPCQDHHRPAGYLWPRPHRRRLPPRRALRH